MLSAHYNFDVIIAGGSLAGSGTAIRLAELGYQVLLIEKEVFPRQKVCGEGLSRVGEGVIKDLLGSARAAALPRIQLGGYRLYGKNKRSFPMPLAWGAGCPRSMLDTSLLERAQDCGVTVLSGVAVRDVEIVSNGVRVQHGDGEQVTGRYAVLAEGGSATITRRAGGKVLAQSAKRYGGYVQVTANRSDDYVRITRVGDLELFFTPISASRSSLSIAGSREAIGTLSKGRHLLDLVEEGGGRCGLDVSTIHNALFTGVHKRRHEPVIKNRVFLVGDACEQLDPVGGLGMTHAVLSGKACAETLDLLFRGSLSQEAASVAYTANREQLMRPLRGFTRLSFLSLTTTFGKYTTPWLYRSSLPLSVAASVHSAPRPFFNGYSSTLLRVVGRL